MLTRDYLQQSGMNAVELSEILGHKTTSSITKKMDVEMPKRWVRLLDERDGTTSAVGSGSDDEARTHNSPPIGENGETDWEQEFRTEQNAPRIPGDTEPVVGPQRIKLSTVEGYIQQIYGGAAYIAENRGDALAADVIRRYSPELSEAWIDYIRSDPRLLEYLEKMMIGTPIGNLIGVHVIAIGSYVFARAAAGQIAVAYAEESSVNGTGDDST
jgi:hypothetical protein